MTAATELELSIAASAEILAGSLVLPARPAPMPAVLLISGSGKLDRNSNSRRIKLGVCQQLATALAAAGFASLRYDKRGMGKSTGTYVSTGLHDNIDDARSALAALAGRPEIDAQQLFVLGHSEGAIIATALATRSGLPNGDIAGAILLAGPARSGAELLRWQVARVAASLSAPLRLLLRLLRVDVAAKAARNQQWLRQTTTDVVRVGFLRINAKWFREFLAHDTAADLAQVHLPICALTGDKDLQVDPDDLQKIAALVRGPVETHRMADLTHVLRCESGAPSLRTYRKQARQPVAPELIRIVLDWLHGRCAAL